MKALTLLVLFTSIARSASHSGVVETTASQSSNSPANFRSKCQEKLEALLASRLVTLTRETYVYHWFENMRYFGKPPLDPSASNFQDEIRATAIWKANRFWSEDATTWGGLSRQVGEGLYTATDPISSMSYGKGQRGLLIKIKLSPGMTLVKIGSLMSVGPECEDLRSLYYPSPRRNLPDLQAAMKKLKVNGILFPYPSQRYDGVEPSASYAVSIIDEAILKSADIHGFTHEEINEQTPIQSFDPPEVVYRKYFESPSPPKVSPTFKAWADQYIIPMSSLDAFVRPYSPR